jgi:hypothetical protein
MVLFHASIAQLVDIMLVSGVLSIIVLIPFILLGKAKRMKGKTVDMSLTLSKSEIKRK